MRARSWPRCDRVTSSEDELLARCIDIGVTSARRLELAAFLGHIGARALLSTRERILLTMEEVTAVLGPSPTTLRDWRRRGCPFERRGRRPMFDLTKVVEWHAATSTHGPYMLLQVCNFWDRHAALRAAFALLRFDALKTAAHAAVLRAVEAWARAPGPETLAEVARSAELVPGAPRDAGPGHAHFDAYRWFADSVRSATSVELSARCFPDLGRYDEPHPGLDAVVFAAHARTTGRCFPGKTALEIFDMQRAAVAGEVAPWALFHDEPLARDS